MATIDINVEFNFKAIFIDIVYGYSQPFWRNFIFLNKIFFYQATVLFEFLFKTYHCNKYVVNNNRMIK
jgi:hypothetical protein